MAGNSNKAYDYLYNEILANRLLPGSPISEGEVASILGLSRTPVREALKILDTEGLVKQIPNRGTFVADITVQDIEEIFSLRELFETYALRSAYRFISDEILNSLESSIKGLDENDSPESFYEVDEMLHSTIINHGGNSRLITFRNMINAQIMMMRRISSQDPSHFKRSKEQHLEIINAIKSRDLKKSEELLSNHIVEIKYRTIEVLTYTNAKSKFMV